MRTPLRFAGLTAAVAVAAVAVAVAVLVLPGLAAANDGGRPEPAPASTAVDLPLPVAATEPAPADMPVGSPVMPSDPGYWTPERMADAKPVPMPAPAGPGVIEPARPAATPVPDPAPSTKPEPRFDPNGSVSWPVMPFDPGYWTSERMANAKPMPMPTPE